MALEHRRIAEALEAYEVGPEIGRGAWGVVYSGRHRHLHREVAIKQLPAAFGADPELRARFAAEAKLIASLDHPHIVPVYDYVERDGLYLIVMEYLTGGTLWSRFTGDGLSMDEAIAVILACCSALDYAHERGILHRDVKPDNLMLTGSGTPKLSDFGIAKLLSNTRTALTVVGSVIGTPAYMAPEQAQGGDLSPATDVYATAMMLYELLSGVLPFPPATDPMSQLYQHVHEPPRPINEAAPAVPAGLCDVIMRALAKSPADRYDSARAFGVALARAATAAWGPDWLQRSGITVMDTGEIIAATRETPDTRRPTSPATVVIRATAVDHPRLEPLVPEPEVVGMTADRTTGELRTEEPSEPPRPPAREPSSNEVVLPPLAPGRTSRRRRGPLLAIGAAVIVVAIGVAAVFLVGGDGDDANSSAASEGATTETDAPATTAPSDASTSAPTRVGERPPGRFVQLDAIRVENGRYIVDYTPFEFTPKIDDSDPIQRHVHFFWDTFTPEQAGTNAAEYGQTPGQWVLWDAPVFDALTVAARPPGAQQICAVVATYDHRVENPDNVDCIELPD